MSNKNKELAAAVYNEIFPSAEEVRHELTRTFGESQKQRRVRNKQLCITSD